MDNGPWLYHKLTNEPKGSGELKILASIILNEDFLSEDIPEGGNRMANPGQSSLFLVCTVCTGLSSYTKV